LKKFKYSLAHRTFALSIKLERIYKEMATARCVNKIERFAIFNGELSTNLDEMFEITNEVEKLIKNLKKGAQNE